MPGPEFYDHAIDVTAYSFSRRAIVNRFQASAARLPRWLNVVRAVSSEGFGRLKFYREVRRRLDEDRPFRDYFEGKSTELPQFYINIIKRDLGALWEWLPEGAIYHDPNAYLKAEQAKRGVKRSLTEAETLS